MGATFGWDNSKGARSFGQELRNRTEPLAQHPELGRMGRPVLPDSVRELVVHRNYIIFTERGPKAHVEILRVKHAAQKSAVKASN